MRVNRSRTANAGWLVATVLSVALVEVRAQSLAIELNRIDPVDNGCRVHLVLGNQVDRRYSALQLDLVVFDREGIIHDRLALEVAPLRARKTAVREFDLTGRRCEDFGRLLLNDMPRCEAQPPVDGDCLDAVSLSSRLAVPFDKRNLADIWDNSSFCNLDKLIDSLSCKFHSKQSRFGVA